MFAIDFPPGFNSLPHAYNLPVSAAARGKFPLRFGRQSLACPLRVGCGVFVGDLYHGIFLAAFEVAVRPGRDAASSRRAR